MENASKAVIMAGSVLIAIVVISLAMYVYGNYRDYAESNEKLLSISNIESFNRFYQSYSSSSGEIRGVDVVNIYNKVKDDAEDYEIEIKINGVDSLPADFTGATAAIHYLDRYKYQIAGYDSDGRISKITITTW